MTMLGALHSTEVDDLCTGHFRVGAPNPFKTNLQPMDVYDVFTLSTRLVLEVSDSSSAEICLLQKHQICDNHIQLP